MHPAAILLQKTSPELQETGLSGGGLALNSELKETGGRNGVPP